MMALIRALDADHVLEDTGVQEDGGKDLFVLVDNSRGALKGD